MIARLRMALLLLAFCHSSFANGFDYREEYVLKEPDGTAGTAHLKFDAPTCKIGDRFKLDIKFTNTGIGSSFYNPVFNSLLPPPAAIAVYDEQKRYLGDLLASPEVESRRCSGASDYLYLPGPATYVGCEVSFVAGVIRDSNSPIRSLPPGKYFLQVIFFKGFITFKNELPPHATLDEINHFYDRFDQSELFRSNAGELTLTSSDPKALQKSKATK